MPSAGNARVTSAHSRSTRIGAVSFSTSGDRRAPIRDDARRLLDKAAVAHRPADELVEPGQCCLWIADDTRRVRVARPISSGSASICTIVVSRGGTVQFKRHLVAGIAADEQHEIGAVHDAVGRRRGIAAGDTGRQPVPGRDDAARTERRGDRRLQEPRPGREPPARACEAAAHRRRRSRRGARRSAPRRRARYRRSATGRCAGIAAPRDRSPAARGLAELDHIALQPEKSRWVGRGGSANAARHA